MNKEKHNIKITLKDYIKANTELYKDMLTVYIPKSCIVDDNLIISYFVCTNVVIRAKGRIGMMDKNGRIWIEEFVEKDKKLLKAVLVHEAGHIANNHYKNISKSNNIKRIILSILGIPQKIEIEADKFAVEHIGLRAMNYMYNYLINSNLSLSTRLELQSRKKIINKLFKGGLQNENNVLQ